MKVERGWIDGGTGGYYPQFCKYRESCVEPPNQKDIVCLPQLSAFTKNGVLHRFCEQTDTHLLGRLVGLFMIIAIACVA